MDKVKFYSLPLLKLLLFAFFILMSAIPFLLIGQFNLIDKEAVTPLVLDIISEFIVIAIVLSALMMTFTVFNAYHFASSFIVRKHVISGFLKGMLIGFGLLLLCSGIAFLNGNVRFSLGSIDGPTLIGYLIFYVLVGIFEEFMFRSFPLLVLSERYPVMLGILLTSLLFGYAHFGNNGFNWLAMLNITLAGVLFSILVLLKRNIYWAVGIHFGWNFTQGVILGYHVSGTNSVGILAAKPVGPVYLSGGTFGIESSVFCTAVLIGTISYLLTYHKIKPFHEAITSQQVEREIKDEFS
ncbi:MAG: CPBP family intramembrane glutamic endopeptidase [Bacteroidia bacterium]